MKNNKLFMFCMVSTIMALGYSDANAQKGEFGVKVMATGSSFDVKSTSGNTVKGSMVLGYGAGVVLGFNFDKNVGIQGELLYTSITQKYKEQNRENKINLRYLNVPLLLSLNTNKTKAVNFNVVVGPQLGFSIGSSLHSTGAAEGDTLTGVLSVKKGDIGIAYGAGFDFGLNKDKTIRLGVGFRGVYGLLDISDDSKTKTTNSYYVLDRAHIQTYSAYVGVSILF